MDQGADQDADDDDHKHETGAAAGMEPGLDPDILHRQGQLPLIAEDGFVLRSVVGKHPGDLRHPGAQGQIEEEDDQLHHTLHQSAGVEIFMDAGDQSGDESGQEQEQEKGQSQSQDHGHADDQLLGCLAGKMLFDPLIDFVRFLLLILRQEGGGIGQGLDAVGHGGDQCHGAADDGPAENGAFVFQGSDGFHGLHETVFGAADDGLLVRPPHEDALHQCLSADAGAKGYCFVFFAHSYLGSKGCASPMGRVTVTRAPPPSAFSTVRVPPWRVTISSQTERPIPLPRTWELPL